MFAAVLSLPVCTLVSSRVLPDRCSANYTTDVQLNRQQLRGHRRRRKKPPASEPLARTSIRGAAVCCASESSRMFVQATILLCLSNLSRFNRGCRAHRVDVKISRNSNLSEQIRISAAGSRTAGARRGCSASASRLGPHIKRLGPSFTFTRHRAARWDTTSHGPATFPPHDTLPTTPFASQTHARVNVDVKTGRQRLTRLGIGTNARQEPPWPSDAEA